MAPRSPDADWLFARRQVGQRVRATHIERLFPMDHTLGLSTKAVVFLALALRVPSFNRLCMLCRVSSSAKRFAQDERRRVRNRISLRKFRDTSIKKLDEYTRELSLAFDHAVS